MSVRALGFHLELRTLSRTEHHQAGHAASVDLLTVVRDRDRRVEPLDRLGEGRRRSQMKAQPVPDFQGRFRRTHAFHDKCNRRRRKRLPEK